MDEKQSLGQVLRAARHAKGLSMDRLAEQLGTTRKSVIRWEFDQNRPNRYYAAKLSEVLGVPVGLFTREDPALTEARERRDEVSRRRMLEPA